MALRDRPERCPSPPRAYKKMDFLNSGNARILRIMCEFEEPRVRLEANGIDNIVMIFGSARSKSREEYDAALAELRTKVKSDPSVQPSLTRLERMDFLCRYHEETKKLAGLITKFSMERKAQGLPTYAVGTGAGPGMMESANEGAWRAGGDSLGFGISLPFETGLNPYVTPELGFEFHYFFTRKYWMSYKCQGLVVAPGGYGTCDELFEILTLMETGKIKRKLPVILFGEQYWKDVLNLDMMVASGLASPSELKRLYICDTAEDAFNHLKTFWLNAEAEKKAASEAPAAEPPAKRQATNGSRANAAEPERPCPQKAYKNIDFIKSPHSRQFRILCEFEETRLRLEAHNINNVLLFVGSGRLKNHDGHIQALADAYKSNDAEATDLLARQQPFLRYHHIARDLARQVTSWSLARHESGKASYHVATGGGEGLLESVNEGAWEAGGKSLAFSSGSYSMGTGNVNRYVTPELAFKFHYFFTRKFWMAYKCMGLVAMPGGIGTCDELFEILTLMQTGKITRKFPVVLFGVDYWKKAVQWQKMADYGMISDDDVAHLLFTDSADTAFRHIVSYWESIEVDGQTSRALGKKKKADE
mmetsp:Transcript_28521/g.62231  ORF Transcript_28521/g.62231 Transcript_28521/m.62231 type:complete len:590 (+) Transcript_28521:47-1816(+)